MFDYESMQCEWVQNDRNNTLTSCWELPSIRYVPARLCLHITSCLLALWAAFVMVQVNFPSKFQIESQIYDHGTGRCTENTDGQGGSKLGIGVWKRWRRTPTTSQGSPTFCERNWELNQNLCWRQCSANTWWMCPKLCELFVAVSTTNDRAKRWWRNWTSELYPSHRELCQVGKTYPIDNMNVKQD